MVLALYQVVDGKNVEFLGSVRVYRKELIFHPYEEVVLDDNKGAYKLKQAIISVYFEGAFRKFEVYHVKLYKDEMRFELGPEVAIDSYFSLVWKSKISFKIDKNIVDLSTIQIGASHLVVEDKDGLLSKVFEPGLALAASLHMQVGKEEIVITETLVMRQVSHFTSATCVLFEYADISTRTRDSLLRILFRKQVEYKKTSLDK